MREGERPSSNDYAGAVFEELYARYLESEDLAAPPMARIAAYAEALVARYPETDDGPIWLAATGSSALTYKKLRCIPSG